jgi:hypothetical protein
MVQIHQVIKTTSHPAIVSRIADQLGLNIDLFKGYEWRTRVWYRHLSMIHEHTGFRPFEATDIPSLTSRLIDRTNQAPLRKELLDIAVNECRERRVELPSEKELSRIVSSARNSFFDGMYPKNL